MIYRKCYKKGNFDNCSCLAISYFQPRPDAPPPLTETKRGRCEMGICSAALLRRPDKVRITIFNFFNISIPIKKTYQHLLLVAAFKIIQRITQHQRVAGWQKTYQEKSSGILRLISEECLSPFWKDAAALLLNHDCICRKVSNHCSANNARN